MVRRTQKSFDSPVLLVFVEVESSVVVPVAVLKVGERFAAAEFLPEKNSINLLFSMVFNQTCHSFDYKPARCHQTGELQ